MPYTEKDFRTQAKLFHTLIKGNKFRYNRLKKMFNLLVYLPMNEQARKTEKILFNWQGNYEQTDDILIMGIRL